MKKWLIYLLSMIFLVSITLGIFISEDVVFQPSSNSNTVYVAKQGFNATYISVNSTCMEVNSPEFNKTYCMNVSSEINTPINFNKDITAQCNVVNLNGVSMNYNYSWYVNGTLIPSNSLTLGSGNYTNRDNITFVCSLYDDYFYTQPLENETVSNTEPEVNPYFENQYSEQTLIGQCNESDINNDTLTKEYKWYVNDVEVSNNQNLTKNYTKINDKVFFSCRAYDGDKYSNWVNGTNNVTTFCHQETANVTTECGGLDTGNYGFYKDDSSETCTTDEIFVDEENLYDGNYSTYGYVKTNDSCANMSNPVTFRSNFLINYTIPNNTINATWNYRTYVDYNSLDYINKTLPSECLEEEKLQLRILSQYNIGFISISSSQSSKYYCKNSSDEWEYLEGYSSTVSGPFHRIYEESIYWELEENIINHGIKNYTNLNDNGDEFTEVGSTVNFTGNVELYDDVDTCYAELKPTTSDTVFDNVSLTTTGITDITFEGDLVLDENYTSDYDNVSWRVWCNDTSGNYEYSDYKYFDVNDNTKPSIDYDNSNIPENGTLLNAYNDENYDLNITFEDLNLFQASVELDCGTTGNLINYENLDINNTSYFYNNTLNIDELAVERCNLTIIATDSHTAQEIPEYEIEKRDNVINYKTENGNNIEVVSVDTVNNIKTKKLKDRYNFEFDYDNNDLIRKYKIKSDNNLYFIENSNYPAHFVAWNKDLKKGNWIDFALPNSEDFIYIINKLNDNEYEIVLVHKVLREPDNAYLFEDKNENIIMNLFNFFKRTEPLEEQKISRQKKEIINIYKGFNLNENQINQIANIKNIDNEKLNNFKEKFGSDNIEFNSIGGTNTLEVKRYFYVTGSFNITGYDNYKDSNFGNYTLDLKNNGDNTNYEFSDSNNVLTNITADSYTLNFTNENKVSKSYNIEMETQYSECEQNLANVTEDCISTTLNDYNVTEPTNYNNLNNFFDNNLSTYASVLSFDFTDIYVNYTVPDNVTFGKWSLYAFEGASKKDFYFDCENKSNIELKIKLEQGYGNSHLKIEEYNGTNWTNIEYTSAKFYDSNIYDEKMTWFTQENNMIDVIYNTSEAEVNINYYDIASRTELNDYLVHVYNSDTDITKTYNVTDNEGFSLGLDANIDYNFTFEKEHYFNDTYSYNFDYQEILNKDIYVNYQTELFFYNEKTEELFNFSSALNSEVRVKCSNNTQVFDINSSSKTIDVNCDYESFKFVLEYLVSGSTIVYYRTLLLDNTDSFNESVYLIDLADTSFVYSALITDDLLNKFNNPEIYVKKSMSDGVNVIQSDEIDMENKVGVYLIENDEYIVEIHSDNRPTYIVGSYSADVGEDKIISLYDINLETDDDLFKNRKTSINLIEENNETKISFDYNDPKNQTESVQYKVYKDNNDGELIYESEVYTDINNLGVLEVPMTGYENDTLLAKIIANDTVNGQITTSKILNKNLNAFVPFMDYVEESFMNWFILILLSTIALVSSKRDFIVPLAVVGSAILFNVLGLFTISITILVFLLIFALIDLFARSKISK